MSELSKIERPLVSEEDDVSLKLDPLDRDTENKASRKVLAVNQDKYALMKVYIKLGGKQVLALLDSGANVSMIHESLLEGRKEKLDETKKGMLSAIGEDVGFKSVGVITLPVDITSVALGNLDLVVVPKGSNMENKCVLGMNAINRFRLRVSPHHRTVEKMMHGDARYVWHLENDGNISKTTLYKIPCISSETVEIVGPQAQRVHISLVGAGIIDQSIEHDSLLLCEESLHDENYCVMPGILDREFMSVLVSSSNGQLAVIPKGQTIGTVSSLIELDEMSDDEVDGEQEGWTEQQVQEATDLYHLDYDQQGEVRRLIRSYQQVLSRGDNDLGKAMVEPHKIVLYDDTPVYRRPNRYPDPVNEALEQHCKELCDIDIIEPSSSPWAAPVVPIMKKSGQLRMCLDYRLLNAKTKPDRSPIPSLCDSVYGLHGMRYFTSLDLVRGYYQVPLDESSRELTAFSTSRSHYQFKRLAFGLRNAPAAFQKALQGILRELPWKKVIVFIDDILIMSESYKEHLYLVERVLQTLGTYGIKIKPGKCQWFEERVDFLGHVISPSGMKKQEAYRDKVLSFPEPQTVSQMREFLGLINFQRKFVPHASTIQKPLSAVTGGKKNAPIVWDAEKRESFNKLKSLMAEDVELAFPCYDVGSSPLELYVDASEYGAGACLRQMQHGELRTITYSSMTFNNAQRNYSPKDRELAALRWGIKSSRSFLYGVEFIVKTDHQPLVYLHNMRLVDSRLARTLTDLADFNFTIEYVPGKANVMADALSRMWPSDKPSEENIQGVFPTGLELDGDLVAGGGDSMVVSLRRAMQSVGVEGVSGNDLDLRQKLVDEILKSPDKYGFPKLDRKQRRELQLMRYAGQLPCLELLLAASYVFKAKILVYFWNTEPVVYWDRRNTVDLHVVHLQCLAGVHFNALRTNDEYVSPVPVYIATQKVRDEVKVVNEYNSVGLLDQARQCSECVPSDHPRIEVVVQEVKFCAILDLGAEVSLVRQGTIQKLREKGEVTFLKETDIEIIGMTGQLGKILGSVELFIGLPGGMVSSRYVLYVVPDEAIPNCLLLGIDFMIDNNLSIDGSSNSCHQELNNQLCRKSVFLGSSIDRTSSNASRGESVSISSRHASEGSLSDNRRVAMCAPTRGVVRDIDGIHEEDQGTPEEPSSIVLTPLMEWDSIETKQKNDPILNELRSLVLDGTPVNNWASSLSKYKGGKVQYKLSDGVLFAKTRHHSRFVVVVTRDVLVGIALHVHRNQAHQGRDKLFHLLSQHVWGPELYQIVEDVCITCVQCQLMKWHRQQKAPPMIKIETTEPFELMAADNVLFPRSPSGYIGCCVLVDHNSKWLTVVPIRNKCSSTMVKAFENVMLPSLLKLPRKLLTDNGSEFNSAEFKVLLDRYSITHVNSTPYKASSNGAVERVNRTVGEFLRSMSTDASWESKLTQAVVTYNNTRHRELGMSPAAYLLSKVHQLGDSIAVGDGPYSFWRLGHPEFEPFRMGQLVMRKNPRIGNSTISKFRPKYDGPYEVIGVNENQVTYRIKGVDGQGERKEHHKNLVPWHMAPAHIRGHPRYRDSKFDHESSDSGDMSEGVYHAIGSTSSSESYNSTSDSDESPSDTFEETINHYGRNRVHGKSGEVGSSTQVRPEQENNSGMLHSANNDGDFVLIGDDVEMEPLVLDSSDSEILEDRRHGLSRNIVSPMEDASSCGDWVELVDHNRVQLPVSSAVLPVEVDMWEFSEHDEDPGVEQSSFSFLSPPIEESVWNALKEIIDQTTVVLQNINSSASSANTFCGFEANSSAPEPLIDGSRKQGHPSRTPPAVSMEDRPVTRSMAAVPEMPYVMQRPIEYTRDTGY